MNWKKTMYAQRMRNVSSRLPRSRNTSGETNSASGGRGAGRTNTGSVKASADANSEAATSGPKMVEWKAG